MKKILLLAVLLSSIAGTTAFAAATKGSGPETINLKMGLMQLPFQHWKHQAFTNGECFHCHKTEGGKIEGKIEGWGKETAHNICIPCHDLNDKGPVECKQCHKK